MIDAGLRKCWAGLLCLACAAATSKAQQWIPLGGPEGGTVSALVYHPATDAVFSGTGWQTSYVLTPNAGAVYRSLDHGITWQSVSADITAGAASMCRVRAMSVGSSGEIIAGLDGGGVWRSTDAGDHWSALNAGLTRLFIRALVHDAGGARFAATDTAGVFTMPAAGGAWTPVNTGLTSLKLQCLLSTPGYLLVGTADAGVFKRVGAGAWQPSATGLPAAAVNRLLRTSAGVLYAATQAGLYSSSDDGALWTPVPGVVASVDIRSIAEVGSMLVAGGTFDMFRSVSGQAWETVSSGFSGTGAVSLCADAAGRVYCGSLDVGVFRSTDAAETWTKSNAGIRAMTIHRLVVARSGTILAGTRQSGLFRSSTAGAAWDEPDLESRFIMALAQAPDGALYAGNYTITSGGVPDGHAWRSDDDGSNWTSLDNGLTSSMVSGFAFSGAPGEVWCSSAWNPGGVAFSGAFGAAWTRLGPVQNIPAYCLLRMPSGDLYFGTEGQQVWKYQASTGQWLPRGLNQSQQFALARDSLGNIYVGNDRNIKGVYRSTDDGGSFLPLNSFPGNEGYAIVVLPNDEIYAGTSLFGIQRSVDHGDSWQTFNSGMPTTACFALALGPDGYLYAGGAGGGVFRSASRVDCAPTITLQPQSAHACLGGTLSFIVTASAPGGGALSYQWRKDGIAILGETLATLELGSLSPADSAAYDCLVTSACGTVASAAATVSVCAGDANGDLMVNTADLAVLLAGFGQTVAACSSGDLNSDGVVNAADLAVMLSSFGQACL